MTAMCSIDRNHGSSNVGTVNPLLRWAGSKRKLLPVLNQYLPTYIKKYIEPFAGSACLFFSRTSDSAIIGDTNKELIDCYKTLKKSPDKVAAALHKLPISKWDYYYIRAIDAHDMTSEERAARFIYLNRFCFNGLYRTNKSGKFNVPYGAPKNNNIHTREHLRAVAEKLSNATLLTGDFERIVRNHATSDSVVYMDPPYSVAKEKVFCEYQPSPFSHRDIARLVALMKWLDEIGARFIVSYAHCEEAAEAFSMWPSTTVSTTRNISGFAVHRGKAQELLIYNRL